MSINIETKELNNGFKIPKVGLGTYKEENEEKLVTAVKAAVKAGYRHFDCAACYQNENHVGRALREAIAESNGELKREDFFVTSKLWNTFHSKEKVSVGFQRTLDDLGLEYIDLFLIHWPMGFAEDQGSFPVGADGKAIPSDVHYVETYLAMEELVRLGKAKSIGLSNFNIAQIKDVLSKCKIRPVCNQVEVHPLFQNKQLIEYCQSENIAIVAYAPLGAPDRPWLKPDEPVVLENPKLLELAKKYNKTPAQIILRWLIQQDIVVIPKSVTPARIHANADIFDFTLPTEDMKVFDQFKEQCQFYNFAELTDNHPFYPFRS